MTLLRYFLMRTMLMFGCLLTLWLVGVRDPLYLIILTGITSIVLSYVVLKGPREQAARELAERAGRRLGPEPGATQGPDEAIEDREDDARRGG
ncbi:MAG TPA: DUF4229 domain-containing protein [Actinomycetales bacterium]